MRWENVMKRALAGWFHARMPGFIEVRPNFRACACESRFTPGGQG